MFNQAGQKVKVQVNVLAEIGSKDLYLQKLQKLIDLHGYIEGLLIANIDDVTDLVGKTVHFGEAFGKGSNVSCVINDGDLYVVTMDAHTVKTLRDAIGDKSICGYNPFDHMDAQMYLTIERAELIKDTLESLLRDKELVLVFIPEPYGVTSCHRIETATLYEIEIREIYPSKKMYRVHSTYSHGGKISDTITIEYVAIDRSTQVVKTNGINTRLLISPLRKTKDTLQKFCNAYDILTEMDAFGMWDST